jgi:hypothetical protein
VKQWTINGKTVKLTGLARRLVPKRYNTAIRRAKDKKYAFKFLSLAQKMGTLMRLAICGGAK